MSAISFKLIIYLALNQATEDHRKKNNYLFYSLHRSNPECSFRDSYFKLWLHPPVWGLLSDHKCKYIRIKKEEIAVLHFCHLLSLVGSGHCVWLFPILKCIFLLLNYRKSNQLGWNYWSPRGFVRITQREVWPHPFYSEIQVG